MEIEINGRGDPLRCRRDTHYPRKLALTSPTSGGHSVSIVRLRTKVTEVSFSIDVYICTIFNHRYQSKWFSTAVLQGSNLLGIGMGNRQMSVMHTVRFRKKMDAKHIMSLK
jgi:hypothetical protein